MTIIQRVPSEVLSTAFYNEQRYRLRLSSPRTVLFICMEKALPTVVVRSALISLFGLIEQCLDHEFCEIACAFKNASVWFFEKWVKGFGDNC